MMTNCRAIIQIIMLAAIAAGVIFFYNYPALGANPFAPGKMNPYGGFVVFLDLLLNGAKIVAIPVTVCLTLSLVLMAITGGRFFCGFLCPIGTLQDIMRQIGGKLGLGHLKIRSGGFIYLKYIILFAMVMTAMSNLRLPWYKISLWQGFLAVCGGISAWKQAVLPIIMLALFLAIALVTCRLFCRFFCPVGAFQAIFTFIGVSKIKALGCAECRANTECGTCTECRANAECGTCTECRANAECGTCTECRANAECGTCAKCKERCPMALDLASCSLGGSPECISCLNCIKPIEFGTIKARSGMTKAADFGAINTCTGTAKSADFGDAQGFGISIVGKTIRVKRYIALMLVIFCCCFFILPNVVKNYAKSSESHMINSGQGTLDITEGLGQYGVKAPHQGYLDGIFTGTGRGYGGFIDVEVSITGGRIAAIGILQHRESPGWYNEAFLKLPDEMIEKQTWDVDALSGASLSSAGLIEAVKDALRKAEQVGT